MRMRALALAVFTLALTGPALAPLGACSVAGYRTCRSVVIRWTAGGPRRRLTLLRMSPVTSLSDYTPDGAAELEGTIAALRGGAIDDEYFVRTLLASQLLVLLDREIDESAPGLGTTPLVLVGPDGGRGLVAFTSPDRASAFAERHPDFPYGLMTAASWLIGSLHPSLGLFINLAGPLPLGIAPVGLQRMRALFALGPQAQ